MTLSQTTQDRVVYVDGDGENVSRLYVVTLWSPGHVSYTKFLLALLLGLKT